MSLIFWNQLKIPLFYFVKAKAIELFQTGTVATGELREDMIFEIVWPWGGCPY